MSEASLAPEWRLPEPPSGVQLRTRRSPRLILLGVLCVCLGGLGAAMAFGQIADADPVIVVERSVARGERLEAGDLGVTSMGRAPGVRTMPADQIGSLIGLTALVDLPQGSVVGAGAIGEASLPENSALVGIKVPGGRIPTVAMPPGTELMLVPLATDTNESVVSTRIEALVVSAPVAGVDGQWTLDVAVPVSVAPTVATLSALESIVVIRTGD